MSAVSGADLGLGRKGLDGDVFLPIVSILPHQDAHAMHCQELCGRSLNIHWPRIPWIKCSKRSQALGCDLQFCPVLCLFMEGVEKGIN